MRLAIALPCLALAGCLNTRGSAPERLASGTGSQAVNAVVWSGGMGALASGVAVTILGATADQEQEALLAPGLISAAVGVILVAVSSVGFRDATAQVERAAADLGHVPLVMTATRARERREAERALEPAQPQPRPEPKTPPRPVYRPD